MPDQRNGAGHFDNDAFNRYFERYTADYHWALKQWDNYERYEGKVVIFHDREVVGVGDRHVEALDAADATFDRAGRPRPDPAHLVIVVYPPKFDLTIWDTPDYLSSGAKPQPAEGR